MIKYFAVKSNSMGCFNRPFIAADEREAMILVRNVMSASPECELNFDPSDYSVYCVGEFNNERGTFHGRPRLVFDVSSIPVSKMVRERDAKEKNVDEV